MNESEERTGLDPRSACQTKGGIEEEEPPGKPRRHPLCPATQESPLFHSRGTRSHRLPGGPVQAGDSAVLFLVDQPGRSQRSDPFAVGIVAPRAAYRIGVRAG